jgi:hypothetical protein
VIGEELRRLTTWSERHRRLLARILIALAISIVVDLVGALLAWEFESGVKGSDIHGSRYFSRLSMKGVAGNSARISRKPGSERS